MPRNGGSIYLRSRTGGAARLMFSSRDLRLYLLLATASLVILPNVPNDACGSTVSLPTRTQNSDDAAMRAQLAKILGRGRRLRDFAPFTTERDESAFLVVFVTGATEPSDQRDLGFVSCPEEVAGTPLIGVYHVGLIVRGRVVNEVPIPGNEDSPDSRTSVLAFPLRNTRFHNSIFWDQGGPIEFDDPTATIVEPTQLITLADYTGDGHAWELRLIHDGQSCGHKDTLLAGYSGVQHRVILYPIVMGKERAYWHDNFFPSARHPSAATVQWEMQCGDHGNDIFSERHFEYNPVLEAWVMTDQDASLCIGEYVGDDRNVRPTPTPTSVRLHVGSVRGYAGETVTVPFTLEPQGARVTGLQIELPVGSSFEMKACTAADDRPFSKFSVSSWGVRAVLAFHEAAQDDGDAPVFTCQVRISLGTTPGAYTLSVSGLLANRDGWTRLQAAATDGEILVVAPDAAAATPRSP